MSSRYGRTDDPNLSGGPWSRAASASSPAGGPARFAASAHGENYPEKYLRSGGKSGLAGRVGGPARSATLPLSLLFPILVLLMLSVTLRPDSRGEEVDAQLGVRLVAYALAALSVLFALGSRNLRFDAPILAWALVPIVITATALYAPDSAFAFTAGLAHLSLLLFAWRMTTRHGQTRIAFAIVMTGMIVGALSILVYYAYPDLGRSAANVLSADRGGRMRGVTAQPNSLGFISTLTVLLAFMHFRAFTAGQRLLAISAIVISAVCIVYSDSRTSIAALLLCLLLWGLCRANAALNLFAIVGIALTACLIITFVPDVSAYLSRGADGADDLASLNGRSRIWDVAWESIDAHLLLGQGYGSSGLLLTNDGRLFAAAVNTHNMYLELLFSGGVVLMALFVIAVTLAIIRSVGQRRVAGLIVLLFFLIRGAAESAPYAGLPLFQAFAFYTAIAMCLARSQARPQAPLSRPWLRPMRSSQMVAGVGRSDTGPGR